MLDIRALEARRATNADHSELEHLVGLSIRQLQQPFLGWRQIEACFSIMKLDTQLIEDGTYYVVEDRGELIGCGGWSRRSAMYCGGDGGERDAELLDPAQDAAKIRAMYTHPEHARRGVGRLVLKTCEAAARADGFRRVELIATLAGEPLYRACGYRVIDEIELPAAGNVAIPGRLMGKDL